MAMTEESNAPSFGRLLKSLRAQKNIQLDEISRITRISLDNLIKLESEDHARLPAPVHVKGFLRAYAQVLWVDPNEIIRRYKEDLAVYQKASDSAAHLRSWLGFWPRLLVAIIVLGGIITVSVYSVSYFNRPPMSELSAVAPVPAASSNPIAPTAGVTQPPLAGPTPLTESKKLMLRVVAVEPTHFKVIIDGQTPREYQLKPEDRLELEARNHFNLLLDNATGVQLFLNDQPVQIGGRAGQPATILLPLKSR